MPARMVNQLWSSIADAGRDLLWRRPGGRRRGIEVLVGELLSTRGEASGAALAREVVEAYRVLPDAQRLAFFQFLARDHGADEAAVTAAIDAYRAAPGPETLRRLGAATEAPRLELFRRMNMAPKGTHALVRMRAELLTFLPAHEELFAVDADMRALLSSWFNPGFLSLERIDWNSPAALLEKLVRYERVHRMGSLEDLKRRLGRDRRCFGFFHPALPGEPLIFVQVALVHGLADRIQPLLDGAPPGQGPRDADTAIFYSISNCQEGLRGVNLGNFLIKLVVADLQHDLPGIDTFATLSPVPGFRAWLEEEMAKPASPLLDAEARAALARLATPDWPADAEAAAALRPVLCRLCAHYLVREKRHGRTLDPVARFHLGNGARLARINWLGDPSAKGLAQSCGILVNYHYDPGWIERNHEAFASHGEVAHASAVRGLLPKLAEPARPALSP